jgi:hypothetical protein
LRLLGISFGPAVSLLFQKASKSHRCDKVFHLLRQSRKSITCVALPKEKTAFLVHQEKGLLIIGDAVCGGRADIRIPDREIGVYPINRMATFQNEGARKTLSDLMEYPFDAICFGHGTPILSNGKAALQRFIDTCRNPVLY